MGMGQNINFTPYVMPQINFGGMYPSYAPTKTESPEEAEKRRKKEEADKAAAEFKQRMDMIKLRMENQQKLQQQIDELEKYSKNLYITIDKAKSGTESEDGTIKTDETWDDYKKLPWWKKSLRAVGQVLQGTAKLAMSFVGYETDPKTGEYSWNWKKGLRNAAIAAGCIALTAVPVVGPAFSTGLLASGVLCGTYGAGMGIYKAIKADSPKELDNAYQDIGAGITIGFSSALGLRGLGKGLQAGSATTTGSSMRAIGSNAFTQGIKGAYRATANGAKSQRMTVAAQGFGKTYIANLKNSFIPKLGKSKFENARYDTTQNINSRLNEITQELNNPAITQAQKAILQREEALLQAQKVELGNVTTRDGWKNLRTDSKLHNDVKELQAAIKEVQTNGTAEINGNTFNNENLSALQEAAKRSKNLSKQIEKLSKIRSATIKKMAFHKKFASEVEAYTGKTRNNRLGRIYDAAKLAKSDITWKKSLAAPFKAAWSYMNIPFKVWGYADKNGGNGFYKIQETFIPVYEAGMLDSFLGFGKQTLTTTITSQNEKGETIQEEVAVTKDVLSKLEQEKQKYDEALRDARIELAKIYTA